MRLNLLPNSTIGIRITAKTAIPIKKSIPTVGTACHRRRHTAAALRGDVCRSSGAEVGSPAITPPFVRVRMRGQNTPFCRRYRGITWRSMPVIKAADLGEDRCPLLSRFRRDKRRRDFRSLALFSEAIWQLRTDSPTRCCGRDDGHPPPPAQNRTCRIAAYGSYL